MKKSINEDALASLQHDHPGDHAKYTGMDKRAYLDARLTLVAEYKVCPIGWLNSWLGKSPSFLYNVRKNNLQWGGVGKKEGKQPTCKPLQLKAEPALKLHEILEGAIHIKYSIPELCDKSSDVPLTEDQRVRRDWILRGESRAA